MRNLLFISICFLSNALWAQSGIQGEEYTFSDAELATQEVCVVPTKIPNGEFSKKDLKTEKEYCEIDLYSEAYAVCPKTWSTSPGTMVYKLGDSGISADEYEASSYCGNPNKVKAPGVKTAAKIKTTMHQNDTSGTYSKSSIMYYQLSRYFDAKVEVPVVVYRELDRNVYLNRGTAQLGQKRAGGAMNRAGWNWMLKAVQGKYTPAYDMYADDSKKNIYGIMVDGPGERYGAEFNGIRGGGYVQQNERFQLTPGFIALKTDKPLSEAIAYGVAQAGKSASMKPYLKQMNDLQVAFWMRELIEINLLDFIFSQQDRVGNIDFEYYWYYVKNGKVYRQKEKSDYDDKTRKNIGEIPMINLVDDDGDKISDFNPVLIQRSFLNDNDAGTKVAYANWSKKVGHLKNLKHFSLDLYKKLIALNKDLQSEGEIYQWVKSSMGLTSGELKWFRQNTLEATNIIKAQCESGLQFDLDNVEDYLAEGTKLVLSKDVDCDNP